MSEKTIEEENKILSKEIGLLRKKLKDIEKELGNQLKDCEPIPYTNNNGDDTMKTKDVYKYFPKGYAFKHIGDAFLSGINTMKQIQKQKTILTQKLIN